MQLIAYGAQDVYLTGNPQITYFKAIYRRHTNFSIDSVPQTFKGTVDFGNKVSSVIAKVGDLAYRMYLQVDIPSVSVANDGTNRFRWLNWLGHVLVKSVELKIGNTKIDKQYGDWMHIWNELTQSEGKKGGYANAVGNVPKLTQYTLSGSTSAVQLYIPLQFWFCRNPGLALPLIALQYHDVQINIEFRTFAECSHSIGTTSITAPSLSADLYVDYIYLDTDERRRFAQARHEYLIEQVQRVTKDVSSTTPQIELLFDHPIKELIWVVQPNDHVTSGAVNNQVGGPQYFNYTDKLDRTYFTGTPGDPLGGGMYDAYRGAVPLTGVNVTGEGVSAGANVEVPSVGDVNTSSITQVTWENLILANVGIHGGTSSQQMFNHTHADSSSTGVAASLTNLPLYDSGDNPIVDGYILLDGKERISKRKGRYFNILQPLQVHTNTPATGINVYSFSLDPEVHQPSGTCNFSKIEDAKLVLTLTHSRASEARVYAVNYNILRIMSGMAGLAYST